jgi:hypothetical protein
MPEESGAVYPLEARAPVTVARRREPDGGAGLEPDRAVALNELELKLGSR